VGACQLDDKQKENQNEKVTHRIGNPAFRFNGNGGKRNLDP
jgi:hypothetical protein